MWRRLQYVCLLLLIMSGSSFQIFLSAFLTFACPISLVTRWQSRACWHFVGTIVDNVIQTFVSYKTKWYLKYTYLLSTRVALFISMFVWVSAVQYISYKTPVFSLKTLREKNILLMTYWLLISFLFCCNLYSSLGVTGCGIAVLFKTYLMYVKTSSPLKDECRLRLIIHTLCTV